MMFRKSTPPLLTKTVALTGLVASTFFVANPAEAATFTYNGTTYNVTTQYGTYADLQTTLEANPWWGNASVAQAFAQNELDNSSGDFLSPWFLVNAYYSSEDGVTVGAAYYAYRDTSFGDQGVNGQINNLDFATDYAVATASPAAVPEPLTILGAMTACGLGASFKRKLAKVKKEQEDA